MKANHHTFLLIFIMPVFFIACSERPKDASVSTAKTIGIRPENVQVYRTMMPDAGPSAFAVRFQESGVALCYDPVRGGVNYVWNGGFDLKPTVSGKINKLAVVEGLPFYQEKEWYPLRTSKTV